MAAFPRTRDFLGESALGIFGAGYLGGTIASCLLRSGFPASRLRICRRQSSETQSRLSEQGISECVADSNVLTQSCRIILYTVRPQNVNAIAPHAVREDALIVSFLAGVPLARLPVRTRQRARVMPSAPATISARNAIAGVFPSDNPVVEEMLGEMGIQQLAFHPEDDVHAFTEKRKDISLPACEPEP
ncbi:MAG TPA: NAD(P)-binding domain-containing protein [Spirochaetia bacterium]|nr:NAD(P)-binding domain-containing protein [Spirochaetia bacterium]